MEQKRKNVKPMESSSNSTLFVTILVTIYETWFERGLPYSVIQDRKLFLMIIKIDMELDWFEDVIEENTVFNYDPVADKSIHLLGYSSERRRRIFFLLVGLT